jgi:hypothetical protein
MERTEAVSLNLKLQSASMICLMIATSLAWATGPTGQQTKTIMNMANSEIASNYATLKQLAAKAHATAVAITQWANAADNDGSTARWDREIRQNKAKFFAPMNAQKLHARYEQAQDLGYRGTYEEFSKHALAITKEQRQKAWDFANEHLSYRMLVKSADSFEEVAKHIDAMAENVKQHVTVVYASFHWTSPYAFFELPIFCGPFDAVAAAWIIFGEFTFEYPPSAIMFIVGTAWFGLRTYAGC